MTVYWRAILDSHDPTDGLLLHAGGDIEMKPWCDELNAMWRVSTIRTAPERSQKRPKIGDAFMATAELMQYVEDPAAASVRAAFEMIDTIKKQGAGWDLRGGIDMGPVVAGVIGRK